MFFQKENISTEKLQTVEVKVEDRNFEKLGQYMKAGTYIQLAADPLIGIIEDVQIKENKIYLLDKMNRVICYDMQGRVLFKIDAVGNGPGEYANINSFAVNEKDRELVIYDNHRLALLFYNSDNGKYLRTKKFSQPTPCAIASADGVYYYDNPYHNN